MLPLITLFIGKTLQKYGGMSLVKKNNSDLKYLLQTEYVVTQVLKMYYSVFYNVIF